MTIPPIPEGKATRIHVAEDSEFDLPDGAKLFLDAHDTAYVWRDFGVVRATVFNEPPLEME